MKLILLSDTHSLHRYLTTRIPDGDILIHAGDSTNCGSFQDLIEFRLFLNKLPHPIKLVISGNHDWCFQKNYNLSKQILTEKQDCSKSKNYEIIYGGMKTTQSIFYLQDEQITINDINFYGSPWTPEFMNWAFMRKRGKEIAHIWSNIPDNTDVLITHGPPYGFLDTIKPGEEHLGDTELLKRIKQIKPKYSIHGHIHGGYGILKDTNTTYINCSICNEVYKPINEPIVIEI